MSTPLVLTLLVFVAILATAAEAQASPPLDTAIEVVNLLRRESSMSISGHSENNGQFLKIDNFGDSASGSVVKEKFIDLAQGWLRGREFDILTADQKNMLAETLREYALQIPEDPYQKKKYHLSFNNGQGTLFILSLAVSQHPTFSNGLKWEKLMIHTSFLPAPAHVIVTESDCDLLLCDRSDRIVYLPVTIHNDHIQTVLNLNLQILDNLLPAATTV